MQRHGVCTLLTVISVFFQEKWPVASACYVGVITAVDVVALPPVSRFNAPKDERLYPTKQRISRYIWIWVHKGDYRFFFIILHDASPSTCRLPTRTGHIGDFDIIDDHRSGKIVVQLNGRLNKAGVISPRFNVPNRVLGQLAFACAFLRQDHHGEVYYVIH
jgi:hypothetical protein